MNRQQRGRMWWRIAVGVIVVLATSMAVLSGQATSPVTARLTATSASSTVGHLPRATPTVRDSRHRRDLSP